MNNEQSLNENVSSEKLYQLHSFLVYANFLLQLYMLSFVSLIGTYILHLFNGLLLINRLICWNIYARRHVSESLLFPEMGLYFLMLIIAFCFFLS